DQRWLVVEARQIALQEERDLARVRRPGQQGETHLPIVGPVPDGSVPAIGANRDNLLRGVSDPARPRRLRPRALADLDRRPPARARPRGRLSRPPGRRRPAARALACCAPRRARAAPRARDDGPVPLTRLPALAPPRRGGG